MVVILVASNTTKDQSSEQAVSQASARTRAGRWRKGVSGNPKGGALGAIQRAQQAAKEADIYAAVLSEFPQTFSALHAEFAKQAARLLARASLTADPALAVRCTNGAVKLLENIREGLARKEGPTKVTALDRHLAGLR
jgi:hypothetical protein